MQGTTGLIKEGDVDGQDGCSVFLNPFEGSIFFEDTSRLRLRD